MKRSKGIVLGLGIAALVLGSLAADAQPNAEQRSRALFDQARQLADANRWTEACPLFQAAHDLHSTGGTALQTANCYEKTGKQERAIELYQFILDRPDAQKNPERVTIAQERIRVLREQLGKPAASAVPSASAAPSVNPSASATSSAAPSGSAIVPPPPGPNRAPAFVAFGVGAAGFLVGGIFGGLALEQANDVIRHCTGTVCRPQDEPKRNDAIAKGWVSNVGFGVGIVGATVGVVVLIATSGKGKQPVAANGDGVTVRF